MNKDSKMLVEAYEDVTKPVTNKFSPISQTIKDVAAAYSFDITYDEELDRVVVKSKDEQFYWDSSYNMHDFFVDLKNYFINTISYR